MEASGGVPAYFGFFNRYGLPADNENYLSLSCEMDDFIFEIFNAGMNNLKLYLYKYVEPHPTKPFG